MRIIRNKIGPIPKSHFENEPSGEPVKNTTPLTKEWKEKIAEADYKYKPGDIISEY